MNPELLTWLRWIGGSLLMAFGLWIIGCNWACFRLYVLKRHSPSWIPLMGAWACSVGMVMLPVAALWPWAWAPFVADWGSIPGVGHTLYFHWKRRRRRT